MDGGAANPGWERFFYIIIVETFQSLLGLFFVVNGWIWRRREGSRSWTRVKHQLSTSMCDLAGRKGDGRAEFVNVSTSHKLWQFGRQRQKNRPATQHKWENGYFAYTIANPADHHKRTGDNVHIVVD